LEEFKEYTDQQILEQLDDWYSAEIFEQSKEWKFIQEACKRVSEKAALELEAVDPRDYSKICELQQIRKLYKDVFKSLVDTLKVKGEVAFEEAKNRNFFYCFRQSLLSSRCVYKRHSLLYIL